MLPTQVSTVDMCVVENVYSTRWRPRLAVRDSLETRRVRKQGLDVEVSPDGETNAPIPGVPYAVPKYRAGMG